MKCPGCGKRLVSDGSHERKSGSVLRHRICACGIVCVTIEKVIAVQRKRADLKKASLCQSPF